MRIEGYILFTTDLLARITHSRSGIDLVERAKDGKLDPVIGRDDEIRRTIQVLCRRTKNNPVRGWFHLTIYHNANLHVSGIDW